MEKPALAPPLMPADVVLRVGILRVDENRFWPQFARAVGSEELAANQQSEINTVFAAAARQFGLELKLRDKGTDFVGSAVNLIGIPLSWDGFLEVCDWALWHKDWRSLSVEKGAEYRGRGWAEVHEAPARSTTEKSAEDSA